jgi:hypothetical protein
LRRSAWVEHVREATLLMAGKQCDMAHVYFDHPQWNSGAVELISALLIQGSNGSNQTFPATAEKPCREAR